MEQNPILTEAQSAQKKPPLTKSQLWLLGGAILIGIALELWMEQDFYRLYSIFWLVTLAVFVAFNWKRVIANKTVLALIVPTLVLCGILLFDYMHYELLGFTMLVIPALLLTIGVFTTQEVAYKREGKAVLGVLRAVFVKPFTAIGTYFRSYAGVFGGKKDDSARHGWIGLAVGVPLVVVVLALLSGADAGMQKLLGSWIENINLWNWFWRVVVVFLSSMLFYSLFYNLTWGKKDADLAPVRQDWKFAGPGVVILLLLAAYALFTYVQFTYLFGGTLPVDLTYSRYARDGFGQFAAVTLINFTLLGISLTKSESGRAIKGLQSLLIAASLIVLASAAWRMLLYVGAYGLTIRRVLPLWLMSYFVFLAVVGAVRVFREKTPFLRIGAFALVYWYALFLCIDWNTVMHVYNLARGLGG
ncbi:MAG TPA: DUF4173 domain-containing protein [Clostridia bacterium]|nr:DUF4173 domain-containing protein [Clostridia bacterium]